MKHKCAIRRPIGVACASVLASLSLQAQTAAADNLLADADFESLGAWEMSADVEQRVISSGSCHIGPEGNCHRPYPVREKVACLTAPDSSVVQWNLAEMNQVGLEPSTRYRLTVRAYRDVTGIWRNTDDSPLQVTVGADDGSVYKFWELMPPKADFDITYGPEGKNPIETSISREFVTPVENGNPMQPASVALATTDEAERDLCVAEVSLSKIDETEDALYQPHNDEEAGSLNRVAVNQHGYRAGSTLLATAVLPQEGQRYRWQLLQHGEPVTIDGVIPAYEGDAVDVQQYTTPASRDSDSGYITATIDFSEYEWSGENFSLVVNDTNGNPVAESPTFSIKPRPYAQLKRDVLRSFYHQRSDQSINPPWHTDLFNEKNSLSRGTSHDEDLATCFDGTDLHGNDWSGFNVNGGSGCQFGTVSVPLQEYSKDVSGGWYDAADHGKYVVNGAFSLWVLQNMIERMQKQGRDGGPFYQSLLDEARYEMDFLKKMQIPNINRGAVAVYVPMGYQDVVAPPVLIDHDEDPETPKIFGTREGFDSDDFGVYQVKRTYDEDRVAEYKGDDTVTGAVSFNGGNVPKLNMKLRLDHIPNASGLVFHSVHDREWTGLPLNPENAPSDRILTYPTSAATLSFSAVAAQCSRVWSHEGDQAYADSCRSASERAWDAAKSLREDYENKDVFRYEFSNRDWSGADNKGNGPLDLDYDQACEDFAPDVPNCALLRNGFAIAPMFGGGGAYGDLRISDEFYWAGTELYLARLEAGHPSYYADRAMAYAEEEGIVSGENLHGEHSNCQQSKYPVWCYNWLQRFDWQNTHALGTLSLLTAHPEKADGEFSVAKDNLLAFAGQISDSRAEQGFGLPKRVYDPTDRNTHYGWGSNGNVLARAIILANAAEHSDDATEAERFHLGVENAMDYLLGRNAMQKSYISGYGKNDMKNPHHRFFAKHASNDFGEIPPGFVAGGPNSGDIAALRANANRQAAVDIDEDDEEDEKDPEDNGFITKGSDPAALWFDSNVAASPDLNDSQRYGYQSQADFSSCSTLMSDSNATNNTDDTTDAVYNPQRCYADHYESFATNEIAINWQASLLWVSEYLDTHATQNTSSVVKGVSTFDHGDWDGWYSTTSRTVADISEGEACIEVTDPGNAPWEVTLMSDSFALHEGDRYRVTFDAHASEEVHSYLKVGKAVDPWTEYFAAENVAITEEPQTFEYTFYNESHRSNARIELFLGKMGTPTVCFDNISVTKERQY